MTNSLSEVYIADEDPELVGKEAVVSRARLITLLAIALLVIGGGWAIWRFSLQNNAGQQAADTSATPRTEAGGPSSTRSEGADGSGSTPEAASQAAISGQTDDQFQIVSVERHNDWVWVAGYVTRDG